ncbi:high affinity immunoglobulin gamma Fc receptor I-like [Hyla sarda]|uniref:high affinity immunoglobulin gamma Fc receptor I-like n=1 Tax=Hyla sarda TaxID=327740 RepID=UPI0024C457A8|nr:high affinity immunoglobulin gamma Fc receptor I-like [Hyla sarda]
MNLSIILNAAAAMLCLRSKDFVEPVRPAVTFTPNWSKVFTRESVVITCVVESPGEIQSYLWYKDSSQLETIGQIFTIRYTKTSDTGDYQCQTPTGEISESVRLEVIYGYLILQTPASVYEGDDVLLRCYSWPGYSARPTLFYKDKMEIKPSDGDTGLLLRNINKDMAGKYRCVKKNQQSSYATYSDESFIHVRELFSTPEINVTPNPALEGDTMTLTCYTNLSLLRQDTSLLFAFYRGEHNIQGFSPSNKYGLRPVYIENSEKYSCVVKTISSNIKKSQESYIQVYELFSNPLINTSQYHPAEGDHMTLTCDTSLNRHRQTTELLFAFFMNGLEVQGFNSSNKYQIPFVQLKDSGNYSCEVKTSTNNVRKGSQEIKIQVQGTESRSYELENIVRIALSSFLFIVCLCYICTHKYTNAYISHSLFSLVFLSLPLSLSPYYCLHPSSSHLSPSSLLLPQYAFSSVLFEHLVLVSLLCRELSTSSGAETDQQISGD